MSIFTHDGVEAQTRHTRAAYAVVPGMVDSVFWEMYHCENGNPDPIPNRGLRANARVRRNMRGVSCHSRQESKALWIRKMFPAKILKHTINQ